MTRFAACFTRISAVLTAGPLRGPGILDLTAMPIDGPVMFSGSWGREWWLSGKRVVHEDGITDEGFSALQRLNDEVYYTFNFSECFQFFPAEVFLNYLFSSPNIVFSFCGPVFFSFILNCGFYKTTMMFINYR